MRLATIDDADALAQVHVEGWRWGYRGVMPDALLDGLTVAARAARWRDILRAAGPDQPTWIACDALGASGLASIGPARDEPAGVGELYALYVAERAAGRGDARALHGCALDALRACSGRAILWVLEQNPRARRFYERHGWRADGGRKTETFGGLELAELRYAIDLSSR
jgi:GNAT superfamily N-acetyltransferase